MLRPFALCATALLLTVSPVVASDDGNRAEIQKLTDGHHWAAAQPLLEKALGDSPDDAHLNYQMGLTLLNQNKGDVAVPYFEKAASLAPTSSEYQRALGDAYGFSAIKAGLFSKLSFAKKCKAAYDKAVELDPNYITARWCVFQYCLQAPSLIGGGLDKAGVQAEAIKKLDPAQGRVAYATLYLVEKKYSEAVIVIEETLKEAPDNYQALYQVGRIAALTGERVDRGLETLRRCLTLTPPQDQPSHAAAQWRIGNLLEKKGDKAGARSAYEAALKIDANFKEAAEALKKLG